VDTPRLSRLVDDAEKPGEPPHARRQQQHDDQREQEAPQNLWVVAKCL
jgi:hypothetical protein